MVTKRRLLAACTALLLTAACDFKKSGPSGPAYEANAARVGGPAPDFTLVDQYGVERSLSDYRGKVILLDISTMWCSFCKIQAEHSEEMYQAYRSRGFILINALYADNRGAPITPEACKDWSDHYGLTYPVVADVDEWVWQTYSEQSEIPLNVIIDRDFIIRHKATGYNETAIRRKIESLL